MSSILTSRACSQVRSRSLHYITRSPERSHFTRQSLWNLRENQFHGTQTLSLKEKRRVLIVKANGSAVRQWRHYYRWTQYKKWSESKNMKVSWDRYHLAILFVDRSNLKHSLPYENVYTIAISAQVVLAWKEVMTLTTNLLSLAF